MCFWTQLGALLVGLASGHAHLVGLVDWEDTPSFLGWILDCMQRGSEGSPGIHGSLLPDCGCSVKGHLRLLLPSLSAALGSAMIREPPETLP